MKYYDRYTGKLFDTDIDFNTFCIKIIYTSGIVSNRPQKHNFVNKKCHADLDRAGQKYL